MISAPYKYRFRRELRAAVKSAQPCDTVLDIACAGLKFRAFFGPGYTGADIRPLPPEIEPKPGDRFVVGDLASNPFFLLGETFDLIVSTHTFNNLTTPDKLQALKNVRAVMSVQSFFILQLTAGDWELLSDELESAFRLIRRVTYGGKVSTVFERLTRKFSRENLAFRGLSCALSYADVGSRQSMLLLQLR